MTDRKITDSEVIEQIRSSLPVVNTERNGLYPNEKLGFVGEHILCSVGEGAGTGDAFLVITTDVRKIDTQFCFEIIDCNNYSHLKPTRILIKGYNPHNSTNINYFRYLSEENISNIIGGYSNGVLTFLIPHFGRYDAAIVRSLDIGKNISFSLSFTNSEPEWESRFVAS